RGGQRQRSLSGRPGPELIGSVQQSGFDRGPGRTQCKVKGMHNRRGAKDQPATPAGAVAPRGGRRGKMYNIILTQKAPTVKSIAPFFRRPAGGRYDGVHA